MIAARVAMDHDAVRRDDHGGSEDRRQHRGEAGRHPFSGYETRLEDGWVATVWAFGSLGRPTTGRSEEPVTGRQSADAGFRLVCRAFVR
jgi:hypothetical protein